MVLFYRFDYYNDWSCIFEISNIKLIVWSLTAMFWHLDGYYLKNRPSNFAESWYNGSSSETIKIFQASLFIMLNLWSRANVHPFAVSHIICCIINTFVILFVGTVYMTVSIIDTYIWWYYYRNSIFEDEKCIFTDLLQNIITIFVTQKRKIYAEEMRGWC